MKKLLYLFVSSILVVACNDTDSDCYDQKPLDGDLTLKVTVEDTAKPVKVSVYQGKYDEQHFLFSEMLITDEIIYAMPVNSYYSASAEYETSGKIILVIDGGKISTKKVNNDDGSTCWTLKNVILDLRLN